MNLQRSPNERSPIEDDADKQFKFILSLPESDRRRQLYFSETDPWQYYHPVAGWVDGSPCDAIEALFELGWPLRLGEQGDLSDMSDWQRRSQEILKSWNSGS